MTGRPSGIVLPLTNGNASAQFNLGMMYIGGKGVPQSDDEAIQWWLAAAQQGLVVAQFNLGVMYQKIDERQQSIRWYRAAADQEEVEAQFILGRMHDAAQPSLLPQFRSSVSTAYDINFDNTHRSSQPPSPDDNSADVAAAEAGDIEAQVNLGIMYAQGQGVPRNDAEAVKWFQKAADRGHAQAQFLLGMAHALGLGVPQDLVQACLWFYLALLQGEPDAIDAYNHLVMNMTAEQVAQVQGLLRSQMAPAEE
ncbi:MAG: sel1 repeat family protein [Magnetococcales bacterium]|nr:sel1 repeat family protein [Magnetococcales bacterium]